MIRIPIVGLAMAIASIAGSVALGIALSGKAGQIIDRLFPTRNAPTITKLVENSIPARSIAAARSDRHGKSAQSASKNITAPAAAVANREPTASLGAPAAPAGNYAWSIGDGATAAVAGPTQADGDYSSSGGVSANPGSSGAASAGGGYAAHSTGASTASAGGWAGAGYSGAAGGSSAAPGGNVPATSIPGSSSAPVAAGKMPGPTAAAPPSGGGAGGPSPGANPGNPGAAPVATTPAPVSVPASVASPTLPVSAPTPVAAGPAPVSAPTPVAAAPTASLPVPSGSAPANSSGPANPNNFVQNTGQTVVNNVMSAGAVDILGGRLGGSGTILATVNIGPGGTLGPGNSPGTLTVSGLNLSGLLETEIEVISGTTYHDILIVEGTANFNPGSTLHFVLYDSYTPSHGDHFEFLTAELLTGLENITTYSIEGLPAGFGFQVYADAGFDLWVRFYATGQPGYVHGLIYQGRVPAPSSLALGLLGLAILGWHSRRRGRAIQNTGDR